MIIKHEDDYGASDCKKEKFVMISTTIDDVDESESHRLWIQISQNLGIKSRTSSFLWCLMSDVHLLLTLT